MALPQITIPRIEALFHEAGLNYSVEEGHIESAWPNVRLWIVLNEKVLRFLAQWRELLNPADHARALDAVTHRNRNYFAPKSAVVSFDEGLSLRAECAFWVAHGMSDEQLRRAFDISLHSCLRTIDEFDEAFSSARARSGAASPGGEA